jgi:hypothetical protein
MASNYSPLDSDDFWPGSWEALVMITASLDDFDYVVSRNGWLFPLFMR